MAASAEELVRLTSVPADADKHDAGTHSDTLPSAYLEEQRPTFSNLRSRCMRLLTPKRNRRSSLRCLEETREMIRPGKRKRSRLCFQVGVSLLLLLGAIQLCSLVLNLVIRISPNGVQRTVKTWALAGHIGVRMASWPTDFSQGILPIPCHSHNDYWRTVPLFSAIEVGCTGVEADIWLFEEQLYVGHSIASLTRNRTINSLYINPLLDILRKQNPKATLIPEQNSFVHGVFDTVPEQPLIFLIDFKTAGDDLWPYVQSSLEPLRNRNYLTRFNGTDLVPGPITVVGTGNTPLNLVTSAKSNPHRDIFFDAPLDEMFVSANVDRSNGHTDFIDERSSEYLQGEPSHTDHSESKQRDVVSRHQRRRSDREGQGKSGTIGSQPSSYNSENSYYASVAFGKVFGRLPDGKFSENQMELLRGQIRGAHNRGLKVRYWDLPFWPIGLRNYVWDILVQEGVDMLNVDDLKGATKRNWNDYHGWWKPRKGDSNNV